MNIIIKSFIKQFLIIFLYFIITVSLQLLFKDYLYSYNQNVVGATYLFIELCILIIFVVIFRNILIPNIIDFKKNGLSYIKKYNKYYIYGLIIMIISNIIINSLIGLPTNEVGNRDFLKSTPIFSLISMIVVAPFTEELMTRTIFKDTFKHKIIYYLLSSFIFGFLHILVSNNILELLYIISYGSLGYAFAVIYNKSNNICTSIFFHGLHNLITIMLIFLGGA